MKIMQKKGDRSGEAAAWHALATIDLRTGNNEKAREKFEEAMKIDRQIGDRAGEAQTLHQLATIDLKKGDNEEARKKFEESMRIKQQIGDRSGEAVTLHSLASIDLEKGDYEAARENLEKTMKIVQQTGNRLGQAATFNLLGVVAWKQGRLLEGMRLVALANIIISSIGHADAKKGFESLSRMAFNLSYTQGQLDALQMEVAESYAKDRGQSLLDAAFPKA
jgi:tetratricopeptide (TPR) repeat protein